MNKETISQKIIVLRWQVVKIKVEIYKVVKFLNRAVRARENGTRPAYGTNPEFGLSRFRVDDS